MAGLNTTTITDKDDDGIDIDAGGAITIDSAGVSIDSAGVAANFTVASDGAAEDLTISVTGTTDSSVVISSSGTGADAVKVSTSAGSIDIDSADNIAIDAVDEISIATTSADGHMTLTSAHTSGLAFHIDANANAGSEVQIDAGILDIDVTGAATLDSGGAMTLTGAGVNIAGGSSEVDITTTGTLDINANAMDMDLTDSSSITITSSEAAEDLIIEQVGGNDSSIIIQAAGTGTDAIKIDATAGDMQIAPTLADGKTLKIGKASAVEMVLSPHGTPASEKFSLTNTAGTAVDAIDLQSVDGGIKLDAGLDNAAAIHLDSASGVTIAGGDNNDSVYIENSALELEQISAPTSTTNKLYNVGGTLTWNGGALAAGSGATTSNANVFTAVQTIAFDTNGEGVALVLSNTDDDTDADGAVSMRFDLEDSAGTAVDSGKIKVSQEQNMTATGSTQDTKMHLQTSLNGTLADKVTLDSAGNVSLVTDDSELRFGAGDDVIFAHDNGTGMDVTSAGDFDISSGGNVTVTSTVDEANAIYLRANAGTSETIKIHADQGTDEASIELTSDAGGIDLNAAAGKDVTIDGGQLLFTSAHDVANSIYLRANAGTSETIKIHADQGTGAASIELTSDAGSIDINAADNITIDASDDIALTTGTADGLITLHSAHTAGQAILIDANAHAGSILDIDAGILDIDVQADAAITSASLTVTTDTATFTSANAEDPLVIIKNTTNDANGAILRFVKDKGAAGAANDFNGRIQFFGDDANQDQVKFGEITSQVKVHTDGQEGGKFSILVAEHNGTPTAGLVIEDGSEAGELDVTIGAGAASVTTIAGTLDLGDRNITNVGAIACDEIVGDADTDTSIEFAGSDVINIKTGNNTRLIVSDSALTPGASDGVALGSASKEFSDLFLADEATIQFGDDQEIKLTHVQDSGLVLESSIANMPLFEIKNTENGGTAPRLRFNNARGAAGSDGDDAGIIEFYATDAGNNASQEFARITADIVEADHGSEAGKIFFNVAENDGNMTTTGLAIKGSATVDGQVDIDLGSGSKSLVALPGTLMVGGDIAGKAGSSHRVMIQQLNKTDNALTNYAEIKVPNPGSGEGHAAVLKITGTVYEKDGGASDAIDVIVAISRTQNANAAITVPTITVVDTGGGHAADVALTFVTSDGTTANPQTYTAKLQCNTGGDNYSFVLECTLINGENNGVTITAI